MISAADLDLFKCVDTPEAALLVLQTTLQP